MDDAIRSGSLWNKVIRVLATDAFRAHASEFDRRLLIGIANSLGGPLMHLLHWKRLADLGRIPRAEEGHAVNAISGIDAFGAPMVEIFMVSHRWLRPSRDRTRSHTDGPDNEKARTLNQFSLWRRQWVQVRHGFLPEIYYWIDYSCINQDEIANAVAMLPLWVACCERFLRIETDDYNERTWCRVELLLSYMFSFADHHLSVGLDFHHRWPYFGREASSVLLDPRTGELTDPDDMKLILPLVELAGEARRANENRTQVRLGETTVKCYRL